MIPNMISSPYVYFIFAENNVSLIFDSLTNQLICSKLQIKTRRQIFDLSLYIHLSLTLLTPQNGTTELFLGRVIPEESSFLLSFCQMNTSWISCLFYFIDVNSWSKSNFYNFPFAYILWKTGQHSTKMAICIGW